MAVQQFIADHDLEYSDNKSEHRAHGRTSKPARGPGITWKMDVSTTCRTLFEIQGTLDNTTVANPHSASIDTFVSLALSQDLGHISATAQSVVFAFGLLRSHAAKVVDLSQASQERAFFYETMYPQTASDPTALVNDFLANYSQTLTTVQNVDTSLMNMAKSVTGDSTLWDLVALATRQTTGNTELTVARGSDGALNQSDVMLFMRDPTQDRTQPVELLYASFPLFMTIDPSLGKPLLEPLLRLQNSPQYRNSIEYAANDLSNSYPTVVLTSEAHLQGVEQTGNMLIMSYAQARFSGDPSLVENYYSLLSAWADYLIANSLELQSQTTTDSSIPNDPNLGIKRIIGIKTMSAIASALRVPGDVKRYSDEANKLYGQWRSSGALTAAGNLAVSFNSSTASPSMGYNLFADKWLNLSVVDSEVYDAQTALVKDFLAGNSATFGIPTAGGNNVTSSWSAFIAASVTDESTRVNLLDRLHARASSNQFTDIWSLEYNASTGSALSGSSSPGQGAFFAPIALSLPTHALTPSPGFTPPSSESLSPPSDSPSPSTSNSKSHASVDVRALVGGVIGGIIGITALCVAIFFTLRRRRHASSTGITTPSLVPFEGSRATAQSWRGNRDILPFTATSYTNSPRLPLDPRGPDRTPLSSKALMSLRHGYNSQAATPPDTNHPFASPESSVEPPTSESNAASMQRSAQGDISTRELREDLTWLMREMASVRAGLELPPTYE